MKLRSRILRPGFFSNEFLPAVEPHARLLFAGLWLMADKEGRLEDRPLKIRGLLFPYEPELNVDELLAQLSEKGFIVRYKIDSQYYIEVVNFKDHQQSYHNETDSVIPEFGNGCESYVKRPDSYSVATNKNKSKHKNKHKSKKENKNENKEIIELIIHDLNEKSGKNYKYCESNIDIIDPRLKEGRKPEDFFHINTVKCQEWLNTEKAIYIRPETLYAKKHFESYLNQMPPDNRFSDITKHNIQVGKEWLAGKKEQINE